MNKATGGDGIPAELLQIWKDDALIMPANLENSAVTTGLEKVSFHFNLKESENGKWSRSVVSDSLWPHGL